MKKKRDGATFHFARSYFDTGSNKFILKKPFRVTVNRPTLFRGDDKIKNKEI